MRFTLPLALSFVLSAASFATGQESEATEAETAAKLPRCPSRSSATYDYLVVGGGTGGGVVGARLADKGFKVLAVDAGHSVNNVNTTVPFYLPNTLDDPEVSLDYTLDFYPSSFTEAKKNDAWYPRARGLGGCTLHNALINLVACTSTDFNDLAATFNDNSWKFESMWEYFKLLERNHYIPNSPDHGYNGWLDTNMNPLGIFADPALADPQFQDIFNNLVGSGLAINDINSKAGVSATGVSLSSNTANELNERATVRSRIEGSSVKVLLDTLVTKILLCNDGNGPEAYGIQIAEGAALPIATNFKGKKTLKTRDIIAKKEVILSAGVFQSPQLLMLSGIGPSSHLRANAIAPVVNLAGVGANLQDHDEVSTIYLLKDNHTALEGCVFGLTPQGDPCLAKYLETHENIYAFGPALLVTPYYYDKNSREPDMLTYWTPGHFKGFVRGVEDDLRRYKNAFTAVSLRPHASSRGYVKLTGNHPQDLLDIQKNQFQNGDAGKKDLAAMIDGVKRNRATFAGNPNIATHIATEFMPGAGVTSDADLRKFVLNNVFGHHACCTNAMGGDNDKAAVLDSRFRVRGVRKLRVVDMSSWRVVPGYFPATPMMILAEKAAALIIADA